MRRAFLAAALLLASAAVPSRAQETSAGGPGFRIVEGSAIALLVADAPAMAAWYAEAFGLRPVKRLQGEGGAYDIHILSGGGLIVELIQLAAANPRPPDLSLGLFKAGLFVDDIEAAYAWISTRASGVDAAPFADEKLRVESFVLRDPEGNRLQLFARLRGP